MESEEIRSKMQKVVDFLIEDLNSLQVGRANPSVIEKIMIEAYDSKMPLVELATIMSSESSQLVVTPFDQTILKNIERALSMNRDLGLTVKLEEDDIRIQFPPLTEERRQEFTKLLKQKVESARVMVRQVRHEKQSEVKKGFENKEIDEDQKFKQEKELQDLTDEFNKKIEEIGQQKEKELLSI